MFLKVLKNIRTAGRTPGTYSYKLSVLKTLTKFQFLNLSDKKKNEEVFFTLAPYKIYGYSYETLDYLYREIFLNLSYNFDTKNEYPVIIDCGSNIGMATLFFKKKYPQAKVLCFEPNPSSFKLLNKNIEENGLSNVELHNIALSNQIGEIEFFIGNRKDSMVGSIRSDRAGNENVKVKAEKLSDFLARFSKINMIKIDVEGAENLILNDLTSSGTLSRVEQIIVEYHHKLGTDDSCLAPFLAQLESAGFEYNIQASFIKLNSFQDILIHCYKRDLSR